MVRERLLNGIYNANREFLESEGLETAVYKLLIYARTPEQENWALKTINGVDLDSCSVGFIPRTKEEVMTDPLYKRAVLEVEQSLDAKCRRFNSRIDKIVEENRR